MYGPLLHSQKPSESYRRLLRMNDHFSRKTWCSCAAQLSWSLSVHHAQQLVLANWAVWVGGSNSWMGTEVQSHLRRTPGTKRLLVWKKKYGRMLCDQPTYISVQFENGICRFKSAPWGAWGCSIVFSQAFRWLFFEQSHIIRTNWVGTGGVSYSGFFGVNVLCTPCTGYRYCWSSEHL